MIKNFLFVAIFTFVIVLSWIIFSVYHTYTTSQISPDAAIRITPIPDKFDQDMINVIKSKKKINVDLSVDRTSREGISVENPVSSGSGQASAPVETSPITQPDQSEQSTQAEQPESPTPTPTSGVGL